MIDTTEIRNDMDVVGSDGQHVGSVDHMEGGTRIKLRKNDPGCARSAPLHPGGMGPIRRGPHRPAQQIK